MGPIRFFGSVDLSSPIAGAPCHKRTIVLTSARLSLTYFRWGSAVDLLSILLIVTILSDRGVAYGTAIRAVIHPFLLSLHLFLPGFVGLLEMLHRSHACKIYPSGTKLANNLVCHLFNILLKIAVSVTDS